MLFGIGCDLCAIPRMEKSLSGGHGATFARRVFGPAERETLGLAEDFAFPEGRAGTRIAARAAADFAAKEAFLKAAGTGLSGPFSLCEIEAVACPPAHRNTVSRVGQPRGSPGTGSRHGSP